MDDTIAFSSNRLTRAPAARVGVTVTLSSLVSTRAVTFLPFFHVPRSMRLAADPHLRRVAALPVFSRVGPTVVLPIAATTLLLHPAAHLPSNATTGPTLGAIVGKMASRARLRERHFRRLRSDGSVSAAPPGLRFSRIRAVPTYEGFVAR